MFFSGFSNLGHNINNPILLQNFENDLNNFFNFPKLNDNDIKYFIDETFLVKGVAELFKNYKLKYISELANRINYNGPQFYNNSFTNVAVHIRSWNLFDQVNNAATSQFDIQSRDALVPELKDKVMHYYISAIEKIKNKSKKPINIHLFSQGLPEDFELLTSRFNISLHLDTDLRETFYHLVYADILIASKSSLSWAAHLYGQNKLVIARKDFWHSWYSNNLLLLESNGDISNVFNIKIMSITRKIKGAFHFFKFYFSNLIIK